MKLKNLFLSASAVIFAVVACQPKEQALDPTKLELTPASLTFSAEEGSQTVSLTAGEKWEVVYPSGAEWVSATPESGNASADAQTITITVSVNPDFERTAELKFTTGLKEKVLTVVQNGGEGGQTIETPTLDANQSYVFKKTDRIVSGQQYILAAIKNGKLYAAAAPTSNDLTKGYGYPAAVEVTDKDGRIEMPGSAACIITADANGLTIKNNGTNRYYVQADTYGSFTLTETPTAGQYYDAAVQADGTFRITNKTVSKWIALQNDYDSFALINNDSYGTLPYLYAYEGEIQATEVTVDQFYTTTDSYISLKAAVAAVGDQVIVLNDGSDKSVYCYLGTTPEVEVGDVVKVTGTKTVYGSTEGGRTQLSQISSPVVEKISDNITAKTFTPTELSSSDIDAPYSSAETSLVKVVATISKDGNYVNADFGGTVLGSIVASACSEELQDGERYVITGYFAGINSRNYFCILPTASEVSIAPYFNVAETEISASASATEATIAVTGNVAWTASCETEGFTLDKTSGEGAATIKVSFGANQTEQPKTATVKVSTTADVATKEYTVTITQAGSSSSSEGLTIVLSAATRPCEDFPNTSTGETTTQSYTIDGYEWTFSPSSGNKFSWYPDKYILWGKSGAYILMPGVKDMKLTSVTILTGKGASTSVNVGVYNEAGTTAVTGGTAKVLNAKDTEFTWTLTGTEDGARYQLRVTSAHNAQLQTLTLQYE